jgi:hypothetical protein
MIPNVMASLRCVVAAPSWRCAGRRRFCLTPPSYIENVLYGIVRDIDQ